MKNYFSFNVKKVNKSYVDLCPLFATLPHILWGPGRLVQHLMAIHLVIAVVASTRLVSALKLSRS